MSTTPGESTSEDRGDDVTPDSSVPADGAGAEIGITEEGGSTFEPEEDPESGQEDQP